MPILVHLGGRQDLTTVHHHSRWSTIEMPDHQHSANGEIGQVTVDGHVLKHSKSQDRNVEQIPRAS